MEDVIFGGTARRKQTGYAEVSLVLDNTAHIFDMDESEVMVTRRYYRSGESEYYINRRSVRLRDVNELFMDTGLGREGYSIIGQGRIDEILSVKSTDRREMFEEPRGSPASATGRRRRNGSWSAQTRTCCGSTTRSTSWSSRWSPSAHRARRPGSSWCCGTSYGGLESPCGWSSWRTYGRGPSRPCLTTRTPSARRRRPRGGGGLYAAAEEHAAPDAFANQLLAALALLAVCAWLGNIGKNNKMFYIPMVFMLAVTLTSLVQTLYAKGLVLMAGTGDLFSAGVQAVLSAILFILLLFLPSRALRPSFAKRTSLKQLKDRYLTEL